MTIEPENIRSFRLNLMQNMDILYLEDEVNDAALVRRYVQTIPLTIAIMDTVEAAQTALLTSSPALILVDLMLNKRRDGFEFIRSSRALGYQQPIVAITGLALPHDIEQCFSAGCTEMILKPYTIGQLEALIKRYLP